MITTPPTRIGRTIVAAWVGSSFTQVRHDDLVVAMTPTPRSAGWVPGPAPRKIKLLHELPSPSSDWTARQPHARGWLG